jgi:hypothetical protein
LGKKGKEETVTVNASKVDLEDPEADSDGASEEDENDTEETDISHDDGDNAVVFVDW